MSDLDQRVTIIEQRVEDLPTKWFVAGTVSSVAATSAALMLAIFWNVMNDFKLEVRDAFSRSDKRFEKIDTKFDSLDTRLRTVETDSKSMDAKLDTLQRDVTAIKAATMRL